MFIEKHIKILGAILCAFILFGNAGSYAADKTSDFKMKPGQPIVVDGDMVEYFEEDGRILAEGNVSIEYGDTVLKCDRIEVNTKTRQALCTGNVAITQEEGVLTGERIKYDFNLERGEIIGAEVDAFPWFGYASESSKVGDNEYVLRKGYITTCDIDIPHYRIKGEEIRIFPDDKIIAKNVQFLIGKVPVLWFPYYYHPIIQSRAKVQFIPGSSTDWGNFILSAWRFYIKGNTKVDVFADYRSKKGFAEGANVYYKTSDIGLKGLGEGFFSSYFIHQNDIGTYDKSMFDEREEERDRYASPGEEIEPQLRKRFQWKHRIDFEPGTVGMLEFNKYSDENVLRDYFYNEYEETNRVPPNYVSFISAQENYIFGVEVNERFHEFYTVVQKHPEVTLTVPDQQLWDTPFYYGAETSASILEKEYAFTSSPPEKTDRFDSFHKLSYVTGIGPLKLTPYATLRETAYSKTRWESDPVNRFEAGGGLDAFMRFFRVFNTSTNVFGLDINQIRHIISPKAKYFHTHQPTVDKNNLYQMDAIDGLEKRNGVTLELVNKLQTKRHSGDALEPVDLVRFIISSDYLFRTEKNSLNFKKEGKFDDVKLDLELRPYWWLYVDSEAEIQTDNESLRTGSIEASFRPSDDFSMDLGYRYEKRMPEPRNQFTMDFMYRIDPKWKVGIYERFNAQDLDIEEQQFSITRDLHCWEVEFVYDVAGSNFLKDEFTLWIAFKIKAFPDLQLGLNRSFSRRPPGSIQQ
ncbi:MAG: LPS assembly protein LptD [Candidatus Omnitrophota bacterium]